MAAWIIGTACVRLWRCLCAKLAIVKCERAKYQAKPRRSKSQRRRRQAVSSPPPAPERWCRALPRQENQPQGEDDRARRQGQDGKDAKKKKKGN